MQWFVTPSGEKNVRHFLDCSESFFIGFFNLVALAALVQEVQLQGPAVFYLCRWWKGFLYVFGGVCFLYGGEMCFYWTVIQSTIFR